MCSDLKDPRIASQDCYRETLSHKRQMKIPKPVGISIYCVLFVCVNLNVRVQAGLYLCRVRGQLLGVALVRQFRRPSSYYVASGWPRTRPGWWQTKGLTASASQALIFNSCTTTKAAELFFQSERKPAFSDRACGVGNRGVSSINPDKTQLLEVEAALSACSDAPASVY